MVAPAQTTVPAESDPDQAHLQWLSKSLAAIQAIKVGMTRKDLLTLFQEDGGLQFMKIERYVYKPCPLIKVDVTFAAGKRIHAIP
jgi:hypothetical protein